MPYKKAHFIGIAGKGMSAVALLLREAGVEITGSDEGFYPPVSDYLAKASIPFADGYKKENIPDDADVIVIGKTRQACAGEQRRSCRGIGERQKSFVISRRVARAHAPYRQHRGGGQLRQVDLDRAPRVVSRERHKDPSYFVGEITKGFDAHAHKGKGCVFVLEGDEYPSANWDESSKFLHYNPSTVLLTSATHDHVNVYPTHESYLEPFKKLLSICPRTACLW